jgi:hypothetical protein
MTENEIVVWDIRAPNGMRDVEFERRIAAHYGRLKWFLKMIGTKLMRWINLLKWLALLLSFGWMCMNLKFAYVIAEMFPARSPADLEAISTFDNLEFVLRVFGPLSISLILIFVRWPKSTKNLGID